MANNATCVNGQPTVIDIFAGCGGATLGFGSAGFQVRAAVELDAVACRTYRLNNPQVTVLHRDIRKLTANEILATAGLKRGQTTALLGCPPCQGFSRQSRLSVMVNCVLYPNGCVERARRTHTEEFYEVYDGDLEIPPLHQALLALGAHL